MDLLQPDSYTEAIFVNVMQTLSSTDTKVTENCMFECRATTCYLVQRRIDMLPKPLTEDICSLRSNVERLAFSAIWEMTQDGQVLHVRLAFHRM